jgi:hypothetical protein
MKKIFLFLLLLFPFHYVSVSAETIENSVSSQYVLSQQDYILIDQLELGVKNLLLKTSRVTVAQTVEIIENYKDASLDSRRKAIFGGLINRLSISNKSVTILE